MLKTSTDKTRHALNGETMGTRWSALFFTEPDFDTATLQAQLQEAVTEVDMQMSTWKLESDLMRFNREPADTWVRLPDRLLEVLSFGLEVGKFSGGAFDVGMGDAVNAWGFAGAEADAQRIRDALNQKRKSAYEIIEVDNARGRARKHGAITLDLSGIAKGYGVDRLAQVMLEAGIKDALLSIDGELVALGEQPDGRAWTVAVEKPDYETRSVQSILELKDVAVATSGDYRHWIDVNGHRLSHTMDPRRGGPLANSPASVTVLAKNCMAADAWATALMVLGEDDGAAIARKLGFDALFLFRDGDEF